jgi:hypothetical protein
MSNKKILIAGSIKFHDLYDWCHGYLQQSGRTDRMNNILYALGTVIYLKYRGSFIETIQKRE